MKSFHQILNIKEGEGNRVFLFSLYFFFLIASFVVGKTARDTFFLSRFDPAYLPQMFIIVAISIAAIVAIYTRVAKQFALIPMAIATGFIFATSLLVMQVFLTRWLYPFIYVWMEIIGTVMMFQFWFLANGAFTTREAKRLFGIISSGGALANILIGFSIRPFVKNYGTDLLLVITSGFIVLCIFVIYSLRDFVSENPSASSRSTKSQQSRKRDGKPGHFLKNPYLKTMTLIIGISAIVSALVDYQLKIIASQNLDEAGMASLFGLLYGIIGVVSFIMQFFVTGRILSRFGVLWGLMFLPVVLLTGNVLILLNPIIISVVVARAGDQIFRYTIHDTSTQLLWLPVAPHEKASAKPFIDGTIKNGAQGLSGLLIIGFIHLLGVRFLSIPSIFLLAVWILVNFTLVKGYIAELQNAIEKRRLDFESIKIDITDPLIVETLHKALVEGDEHQKLFALDSMKNLPLSPWISDLRELIGTGSTTIKRKILELARFDTTILPNHEILKLMKSDEDTLAAEAMIICGQRKLKDGNAFLWETLNSRNDRLRAAAAAGILLLGEGDTSEAKKILDTMLYHPDNKTQVAALKSVGHLPDFVTDNGLKKLLLDDSFEVRNLAIQLASQRSSELLIDPLVENLKHPETIIAARSSLRKYEPHVVRPVLIEQLIKHVSSNTQIIGIIRCLSDYADSTGIDVLLNKFESSDENTRSEIADALLKIARRQELSKLQHERTIKFIEELSKGIYEDFALLDHFQNDEQATLLNDHLHSSITKNKSIALKLSTLPFPNTPIETYLHTLQYGDLKSRSNVLEILDNLLSRDTRKFLIPLLDDATPSEKVHNAIQLFSSIKISKEAALLEWIRSGNEWQSVIALDYAIKTHMTHMLDTIEWHPLSDSILVKQIISRELKYNDSFLSQLSNFQQNLFALEDTSMYSILEKTIFLKGVQLFSNITAEEVSHIAQIAHEVYFSPEETIFYEGDVGNSMFIIVNGRVRIHKDMKEIALLSKGEFIGEMALLDQEPRSASATTIEETVLLQIDGEDFYDLMATRMEIMQGIVKVLTGRLREAIA